MSLNKNSPLALAAAMALLGSAAFGTANASSVLYEGYSPYTGSGDPTTVYPASSTHLVAQAFTLSQTTEITGIGTDFRYINSTDNTGTIFGAIVQLTSADTTSGNNLFNFAPSALAANVAGSGSAYTVFNVPSATGVVYADQALADGPVTLGPGNYAVIFGSGELGTSGTAELLENSSGSTVLAPGVSEFNFPTNPNYNGTAILNDENYASGSWTYGPNSSIVMEVDGQVAVAPTPLPPSWTMMIAGLLGLGFMVRRQSAKSQFDAG